MLIEVEGVVRLESIDTQIGLLQKEIAALPRHIAEIEQKLATHERRLEADRAALAANQRERKRLEGEVQMAEGKISKLRTQMLDAKTNEQYRAFQNEIDFAEREIRAAEDKILDLMGESESLDKAVKEAESALKKERAQVEAEKAEAERRTNEDRSKLASLTTDRRKELTSIAPQLASAYERVKKARGSAVSEALDGRCSKCHLALRPQFLQELKRSDKVMFCENCGRILYINPPRAAEDLAGINALTRP